MPVFQYIAKAASGETTRGLMHGANLGEVAEKLARQGLEVEQLGLATDAMPSAAPASLERPQMQVGLVSHEAPPLGPRSAVATRVAGPLVGKVRLTNLQFFFRQLSTMLNAGINPAQALETLSGQTTSSKLKKVLLEARDHVIAGRPISAAFQRYPEVFSPLIMSMLRAGEEGGFLSDAAKQISEYLQREIELRNMIRRETMYPKIVVVSSIIIIVAANLIISAVAPEGYRLDSPLSRIETWYWLGPLLIGLFLFVRLGLAQPAIKQMWDSITINTPGIGGMVRGFSMAKFGRAFGALYKAGVPMRKALLLSADACGNEALRARMYPAADRLERGDGLTETLRDTNAFNQIVLDMTATGEQTGNVDGMLEKVAEFYEEEGAVRSKQAAMILGVVVFLCVAAYIGFIVISFYTGFTADRFDGLLD